MGWEHGNSAVETLRLVEGCWRVWLKECLTTSWGLKKITPLINRYWFLEQSMLGYSWAWVYRIISIREFIIPFFYLQFPSVGWWPMSFNSKTDLDSFFFNLITCDLFLRSLMYNTGHYLARSVKPQQVVSWSWVRFAGDNFHQTNLRIS